MKKILKERIAPDWGQYFENFTVIYEERNNEQHLILIETDSYGRVLILDGYVQVTEKDNYIYHEMLTHVPLIAHGKCNKVLIVGGGDGGMAKEVLRHPNVEVTMIEIDEAVVKFSKEYLPKICGNVFENKRLKLKISDGAKYVKETNEKFDVIIVDSTDPHGPGSVLFTKEFYTDCKNILKKDGVLVTQNGIPFSQKDELKNSIGYFKDLFKVGTCYIADIPSYIGGSMAFGFATDNRELLNTDINIIKERFNKLNIKTGYYNPEIHKASFAIPNYIKELID